jgi:hypothetical protein
MTGLRSLGAAGILTLCLATVGAAQSTPGAGHWEGSIQVPGQELKIEVDLLAAADGKWTGTISIPAQNVTALPLSDVTVETSAISFAMKGPGEPRFKGTISADAQSIAGDFTQGGGTLPFTLARKGEAHVEAPVKNAEIGQEFEGTWEGALDVNGTTLRLTLKLSNVEHSATGTLVSVDQGGVEIPIGSIVQTGTHVKLRVPTIAATYEGDLKDAQMAGTWTQGPASFPLTFKRPAK